jgi:seryl-tRNA synthetase
MKMEAKKPNLQKEISNNNEIDNLRRELKDEKEKNKKLQDTINNLNNIINQLKQEHYTEINKLTEKNKELEKLLEEKNKEINDYIFKLSNSSNNEQLISVKTGDKIIAVLFMTQGSQDIFNYTMACKTSDLFVRLEERLYHDFPKYRNYETFFMVNTRRIFRFKTLEENKIKNNDIISLFTNE